jgi:hypothetical protein
MPKIAPRLAFFAWALVVSPLVVWLLREAIYEVDGTTGWVWMIGLPAMITIVVGGVMRRSLWELGLGASLSAGVAVLSLSSRSLWRATAGRTASDERSRRGHTCGARQWQGGHGGDGFESTKIRSMEPAPDSLASSLQPID